jgi:hypothetical protein
MHTIETSMPWVGFEPTIAVFKRAKTFYALDRAATVTGLLKYICSNCVALNWVPRRGCYVYYYSCACWCPCSVYICMLFVLRWLVYMQLAVGLDLLLRCPYVRIIIMNIMNNFTLLSPGKFPFYMEHGHMCSSWSVGSDGKEQPVSKIFAKSCSEINFVLI